MGQDGSHSQHQAAPTIGTLHPRCLPACIRPSLGAAFASPCATVLLGCWLSSAASGADTTGGPALCVNVLPAPGGPVNNYLQLMRRNTAALSIHQN